MKILLVNLSEDENAYFKKRLKGHKVVSYDADLDPLSAKTFSDVEIIITYVATKYNRQMFNALKNLKMIATMSTGYDHIDIEEAKRKKIAVYNVPAYGTNSVAEHTFCLLLLVARRIKEAMSSTYLGSFRSSFFRGFELKDKVLGVIGTGHIGLQVIKIAKGFGMEILAYDKFPNKVLEKELGFKYVSLNTLYKRSDIITLHVPLNEDTRHMINARAISKMKRGVVLINTARGGLIDTYSLYEAIVSGRILGVGLDVLEEEEAFAKPNEFINNEYSSRLCVINELILKHKNVVISPHMAYNTNESHQRLLDTTVENIKNFLTGKKINKIV